AGGADGTRPARQRGERADGRYRRAGRRHLRALAGAGTRRGFRGGASPARLARRAGAAFAGTAVIARLSGTLLEKRGDLAVVDVGGVGYQVHVSLQSVARLPAEGGPVQLRTYTHVREDALQLFGFATEEEERLFLR